VAVFVVALVAQFFVYAHVLYIKISVIQPAITT